MSAVRREDEVVDGRERDKHPLVLLAFAVVLQALAVGVLLGARALDPHRVIVGQPASAMRGPVTSLDDLLFDPAADAFVGRNVRLADVPVERVVGDAVFWIGEGGERRLPVVLVGERATRQPEERVEVEADDRVAVFGTLRETRASTLLSGSALIGARERAALMESTIYVAADRVVVLGGRDGERSASR